MLRARALTTGIVTALLSGGLALVAGPAQAATPSLRIADLRTTEAAATRSVTITRAAPTTTKVTVRVASANGTALAPADYTAVPPTTVTFLPGQTTRTVPIAIKADGLDEADETLSLRLSAPVGATIADALGVVTIVDDDATPTLTMTTQTVTEGSSGVVVDKVLTAALSAPSGRAVSAAYAFVQGTATSGVDYEPGSGAISIPPGMTTKTFPLAVDGDTNDEADERLYVQLTSPVNATVATTYTRVTLVDDDAPMTPQLFPLPATTGSAPTVLLKGAASSISSVTAYTGVACSGAVVASGTAEAFGSGFAVSVPDNATTSYSVRSANGLAETSGCSSAVTYTHDDLAPAAPANVHLANATANDNSPAVLGAAEAGSTVRLFTDACASSPVAKASATVFAATGVVGSVLDDTTTAFWVDVVDAAGNRSQCAAAGTYAEDSTGPGALTAVTGPSTGVGSQPAFSGSGEPGATIEVHATEGSFSSCGALLGTTTTAALSSGTARIPMGTAPSSVSYRLLVQRDASGNLGDCLAGTQITYTNTVTETEANDSILTADGPYAAGTSHHFGELLSPSDVDDFAVVVPESGVLAAETFDVPNGPSCAGNALDTVIEVYDVHGALVASGDDSGSGLCSYIKGGVLSAGTYVVSVSAGSGAGTLGYPRSYDLRLESFAAVLPTTTAEVEPNDTPGQSTSLGSYTSSTPRDGTGALTTSADVDHFSFVSDGSTVTVETLDGTVSGACSANQEDTFISVLDAEGNVLQSDDDSGDGYCSRMLFSPAAPGTYYVRVVYSPLAGSTTATVPYRLRLR